MRNQPLNSVGASGGIPSLPVPVANGGTGATTAAAALTNLGLSGFTNPLPIANGGTAGTDTGTAATNLGISLPFRYNSGNQTITLAGSLTLAHGLSTISNLVIHKEIICTTAELGYSINDVVQITPAGQSSDVYDATNINVRYLSTAISIAHKTTGVSTAITVANWRLRWQVFSGSAAL